MSSEEIKLKLEPLRKSVQEQGDIVRNLKASGANANEIKKAVTELKARKKVLEDSELALTNTGVKFERSKLEDLLKQRFVYDQSFSIHGGVQGLYDFGPFGCKIEKNLLNEWEQFFIEAEQMLQVRCAIMTPEKVLATSGHVERFSDCMVKDMKTGECHRADHLVEEALKARLADGKDLSSDEKAKMEKIISQIDNLERDDLDRTVREYNLKAPITGNDLSEAQHFNLMFDTSIGPSGHMKGFLRPETAQGIFVNFQRLLQINQSKLPFAAAQIGPAFRNEISPRAGLLRVREFMMAEIEHFVDPKDKSYPKFTEDGVDQVECNLYSACNQMDGKSAEMMKLGDALQKGIICNETLAYYMGRIYMFLMLIGIKPNMFRFRQHMSNEMAHYACDCWDAECLTSYGWIECVGCADRSCYDLQRHSEDTGTKLCAHRPLDAPKTIRKTVAVPNRKELGMKFKKDGKLIGDHLAGLHEEAVKHLHGVMDGLCKVVIDNNVFELSPGMFEIKNVEETIHVEEIIPNVIEPSFGIGRLMYAVFEQNFCVRKDDEQRTFITLPAVMAPYKCSLLPLSSKDKKIFALTRQISKMLVANRISQYEDNSSGSIGRRYARTDQIGIPFGVTIDFDSVNQSPASVTVRERDSMEQIRVEVTQLADLLTKLSSGVMKWSEATTQFPIFLEQKTID